MLEGEDAGFEKGQKTPQVQKASREKKPIGSGETFVGEIGTGDDVQVQ